MRKFTFLKAAVSALAVSVCAGAIVGRAAVIFDQIGLDPTITSTGQGAASQVFEPANTSFNVAAIDDFTTLQPWKLTNAEGVVFGFSGQNVPALATGWTVSIFNQATGQSGTTTTNLAGDVHTFNLAPGAATVTTYTPSGSFPLYLVNLNVSADNFTLPAGAYWMSIAPTLAFTPNGQSAGLEGSLVNGTPLNARQINPGGGFGFTNQQILVTGLGVNLQYRLSGTNVPEPMSLGLVGLGGVAMITRRRRA